MINAHNGIESHELHNVYIDIDAETKRKPNAHFLWSTHNAQLFDCHLQNITPPLFEGHRIHTHITTWLPY